MSTLRVNTIQDASGGDIVNSKGIAKAWVNFNGTGTVAIRASHNVSSITDNGAGDYTANFTTAMADANYSLVGTVSSNLALGASALTVVAGKLFSSTSVRFYTVYTTGGGAMTATDYEQPCIAVFR